MKIWRINSWLDWTVMSESDKTFSFMDLAIFDITSVTVGMVTGKEYGLDYHCTIITTFVLRKLFNFILQHYYMHSETRNMLNVMY